MRMKTRLFATACAMLLATSAQAATVTIDLSGASTGASITAPGASFAQTFAGQTVVGGTGISGSPSGPLTLAPAGSITVGFFNPGVSAASNSLLSQPSNQGPLSILFDSLANSFAFTMGSSDSGSTIKVNAFNASGGVVGSTSLIMGSGYNLYSLSGLGTFKGLTFFDNNDPAGVRFQNMSYNSVDSGAVPEPATWAMMLLGFGVVGGAMRRRQKVSVSFA